MRCVKDQSVSKQKNGTCFMFFCFYKVDSSMNLSPARSAWVARVAVSDAPSSTFLVSCFVCSPHVAGEGGYFHRRFSGARVLLCCLLYHNNMFCIQQAAPDSPSLVQRLVHSSREESVSVLISHRLLIFHTLATQAAHRGPVMIRSGSVYPAA